jgi:hypothetical protein
MRRAGAILNANHSRSAGCALLPSALGEAHLHLRHWDGVRLEGSSCPVAEYWGWGQDLQVAHFEQCSGEGCRRSETFARGPGLVVTDDLGLRITLIPGNCAGSPAVLDSLSLGLVVTGSVRPDFDARTSGGT